MTTYSPGDVLSEPDFSIDLDLGASPAVLFLGGELDTATAVALGTALDRMRDQGHLHIEVDVAELRFLGTAGLREFVRTSTALRASGGRLTLINLTPWLRRVVAVTGLGEVLTEPPARDPDRPTGSLTCADVEPGRSVISVRGVIGDELLVQLRSRVAALAAGGVRRIEVDLSGVTDCGPDLVPALADACRVMRERYGSLRPVAPSGCVQAALDGATPTDAFALYLAAAVPAQPRRAPSGCRGVRARDVQGSPGDAPVGGDPVS